MKTHFINIRLRNNAGMDIPECQAYAELLNCDSGRWPLSNDKTKITCKKCLKAMEASWPFKK
jgi:hypothetical protein